MKPRQQELLCIGMEVSVYVGVGIMAPRFLVVCAIAAAVFSVSASGLPSGRAEAYSECVPVSAGTSVTVWEQTGSIENYTFSVSTLMSAGGYFWTCAQISEVYTLTSDGTYLKIQCYRDPPTYLPVYGPGGNIVAARLNGVPDYPDGLWASVVVSYKINVNGSSESVYNALGPDTQVGPYKDMYATLLGDYSTEIVLGFGVSVPPIPPIVATVDFDMNSFNKKSKGNWVTAYISLPEPYSPYDIDVGSVLLNDVVPASGPSEVADFDHDEDIELMVKFNRAEALASIGGTGEVVVTVSGKLADGNSFAGSDTIVLKVFPTTVASSLLGAFLEGVANVSSIALIATCVIGIGVLAAMRHRIGRHRAE